MHFVGLEKRVHGTDTRTVGNNAGIRVPEHEKHGTVSWNRFTPRKVFDWLLLELSPVDSSHLPGPCYFPSGPKSEID